MDHWSVPYASPSSSGPKPLPIVGNLFDMPENKPWEMYRQWSATYGSDMVFLHLPMQPTIILGSTKAAMELLDKRAHNYSDRARNVVHEMVSWNFNFAFMRYGPRWRANRRAFHQHFNQSVSEQYRPVQLKEVRNFLSWVLESPQDTRKNLRRMITSIILKVVYGMQISGMDDPYVPVAEKAMLGLSLSSVPGVYWVEYFPIFKNIPSWVPFNRARQLANEYRPSVEEMRGKPYGMVKAAVANGVAVPSVANILIQQIQDQRLEGKSVAELAEQEDVAMNVTGVAYGAGSDTTTSSSESFLLAMAMFPEVQKKAQEELDRVVGPSRLPDYDDMDSLVYIRAIAMEAMRWIPAIPFGVPHRAVADDTYNGYFIPKGTVLVSNTWAMLKDPDHYPEPERFNPDRYIGVDGQIDPNVLDPTTMAFGFGRRICPGRYLSNNTLVLFIASVLHVFDISAGVDGSGNPLKLSAEATSGLISGPLEIPCGLKARSKTAERLILDAAADAEADH